MTQVTSVRKIETHKTVMGLHESLVDLQVGWATRKSLDIDAPFLGVEVEHLKSTSLARQLDGIDVLVTTIVTGAGVTLRVFVGHWGSKSIVDSTRCDILRSDEKNGLALTLDFFFL